MKVVRFMAITVLVVLACATLLFLLRKDTAQKQRPSPPAGPVKEDVENPITSSPTNSSATRRNLINAIRADDLTAEQKTELAKKFESTYKPVVQKWFSAYEDRIPFRIEDLTLDKLSERIGKDESFYLYTFVVDGTTFTIQDSKGTPKVSYLMTRKGAQDLNQLPKQGFEPDLTLPVTKEDVIRMVKADCGVEFKASEVEIKPTAAACALNGGAFVDILPAGADPNNGLASKIDLVFDHNGKLINYERDPFFRKAHLPSSSGGEATPLLTAPLFHQTELFTLTETNPGH